MNTKRHQTIVRIGMFWSLVLLVVPFLARPTRATTQAAVPALASDRWATIDAYVEQERQAARIPGLALGIVEADRIVHVQGFGVADPSGRAVTAETPFYVGSTAKSFTAMAIMQLVEQGTLDLDAPVQQYLPSFTLADPAAAASITVRHLLTQTSGLSKAMGLDVATNRADISDGALERQVRAWQNAETTTPPGTTFQYNNANYVILGLLIETLSGQSYESYLQEHIFAPLEMHDATVGLGESTAQDRAVGYRYWFGVPRAADLKYGRVILPAGGVIASAEEMTHYLVAQLNGGRYRDAQLLSSDGIAEMHQPMIRIPADSSQATGFDEAAYGLGWYAGTRDGVPVVAHPGDLPTYHADIQLLPEDQVGIVLLMNANNRLTSERMRAMVDGVTSLLLGRQPAPVETGTSVLMLVFQIVVGLALVQLGVMGWSLRTIRRWAREPMRRPQGVVAVLWHVLVPLGFHLLLALLFLVGLPLLLNLPLALLVESTPDLGTAALVSGVIAAGWAIVRTILVIQLLRTRGRAPTVRSVVPA